MVAAIPVLLLLVAVLTTRAAAAAETVGFVNALDDADTPFLNAFAQQQQPSPPLVDFGGQSPSSTTIDDDTRALLNAFAAGERVVTEQSKGAAPRGEAKLGGLLDALRSARATVERELAGSLDDRLFNGLSALRRRLGPRASLRLIEEAQKARGTKCKIGAFTAAKMQAAKISGAGAFLAVTGPLCSLQRLATPLQLTLPIACTGVGVLFRETPPIFGAATLAGAKATTCECKAERKWGPEGTAEVVLFDPKNIARQFGLLPPSAFNTSGGGNSGLEGKDAWKAGAADVREAIAGLWGAMLGNLTVKDTPNGAWRGSEIIGNLTAARVAGQAEKVAAKFDQLLSAVGATAVRAADSGDGGDEGGWVGGGSNNSTNATFRSDGGGPSAARREAEARLRSLAGEYLMERLLEAQGGAGAEEEGAAAAGDEGGGDGGDGGGEEEEGEVPSKKRGGGAADGLLRAMRDLARAAVAERAPPGLFAES